LLSFLSRKRVLFLERKRTKKNFKLRSPGLSQPGNAAFPEENLDFRLIAQKRELKIYVQSTKNFVLSGQFLSFHLLNFAK